jgi:hypothetical protein
MGKSGWFLLLVSLLASGCSSIGAPTIPRDRFDYGAAISGSWKEQTLLNIVKIRYMDMPLFVDVASVSQGYNLTVAASLAGIESPQVDPDFTLGGSASVATSPAISYVPVKGRDFSKSFMTPIPPSVILFLMQSGWPADLVLPLTVDSMNGLRSQVSGGANQRLGDEEFYQVIEILREVQKSGEAGMQIQRKKKKKVIELGGQDAKTDNKNENKATVKSVIEDATLLSYQRRNIPDALKARLAQADELLGLSPGLDEIEVVFGLLPENKEEIAMLTHSMLSILISLAFQVDVPPEHVADGRTVVTVEPSKWFGTELGKLIDVKYTTDFNKPNNAIAAVRYRDMWFWIDDRDLRSKSTLLFLMILLSLTESGDPANLPVVTIPLGG